MIWKEYNFFVNIKQYFWKNLKCWLEAGKEIHEPKINIQQISKKHYLIIKAIMYNFMYVDRMKIKLRYITNIFL